MRDQYLVQFRVPFHKAHAPLHASSYHGDVISAVQVAMEAAGLQRHVCFEKQLPGVLDFENFLNCPLNKVQYTYTCMISTL